MKSCSAIGLKIHNINYDKLVEILKMHGADNASGYIFHCVDGFFNISDTLFSVGVV